MPFFPFLDHCKYTLERGTPDSHNSKFRDEACAHQTGSARLSPCHLQKQLIPWTSRNIWMCTVWTNMWKILYRDMQEKNQIHCELSKRLNAMFCICTTSLWPFGCNKSIITFLYVLIICVKISWPFSNKSYPLFMPIFVKDIWYMYSNIPPK